MFSEIGKQKGATGRSGMLTATTIPAIPDNEATHDEAKEFSFFEAHGPLSRHADGNEIHL